jgi:hypothetical protein
MFLYWRYTSISKLSFGLRSNRRECLIELLYKIATNNLWVLAITRLRLSCWENNDLKRPDVYDDSLTTYSFRILFMLG